MTDTEFRKRLVKDLFKVYDDERDRLSRTYNLKQRYAHMTILRDKITDLPTSCWYWLRVFFAKEVYNDYAYKTRQAEENFHYQLRELTITYKKELDDISQLPEGIRRRGASNR